MPKHPKRTTQLKRLRRERGVSQLDTATATKIPIHRYWMIENGYREANARERRVLARYLRTTVRSAFGGTLRVTRPGRVSPLAPESAPASSQVA